MYFINTDHRAKIKFMFEILNFSVVVPYRYVKFYFINRSDSDEKAEMQDKAVSQGTFLERRYISSEIPMHLLLRASNNTRVNE